MTRIGNLHQNETNKNYVSVYHVHTLLNVDAAFSIHFFVNREYFFPVMFNFNPIVN